MYVTEQNDFYSPNTSLFWDENDIYYSSQESLDSQETLWEEDIIFPMSPADFTPNSTSSPLPWDVSRSLDFTTQSTTAADRVTGAQTLQTGSGVFEAERRSQSAPANLNACFTLTENCCLLTNKVNIGMTDQERFFLTSEVMINDQQPDIYDWGD